MTRIIAITVISVAGLLGVGASIVGRTHVARLLIEASVIREDHFLERAWQLPVAATFERKVSWQTNGSRCGPAAVANAYRSLATPPARSETFWRVQVDVGLVFAYWV